MSPELLWPVTNKVKIEIEKCVAEHKEFFWNRPRPDTLELRVVTYTYENGNFRSRVLWKYEPFSDSDIEDVKRLHNCILSLYPEVSKHIAVINDLKFILESMWYSGLISKVPYPEFKTVDL
jgi:hypothetical protein